MSYHLDKITIELWACICPCPRPMPRSSLFGNAVCLLICLSSYQHLHYSPIFLTIQLLSAPSVPLFIEAVPHVPAIECLNCFSSVGLHNSLGDSKLFTQLEALHNALVAGFTEVVLLLLGAKIM